MKALAYGAVLAVLWLVCGLPVTAPASLLPLLANPAVVAFAAGLLARPYVRQPRRWAR